MSCQILFLFDLDQCLPLEEKLESEKLDYHLNQIKDVCSQLLKAASHLDGPHLEHHNLAHFSFKFYSSTGYFLVPENQHGFDKFQEFSEDSFDVMDNALSERFETLLQTSKTNSFKCEDFKHHISSSSSALKCHSVYLQKALEEVAVMYHWDRPLLHSPVKNQGKLGPIVNAIYVFTKLPRTNGELGCFLGKSSIKRQLNQRDLHDKVFNASKKSCLNLLKGDNAGVSLNVIDTDDLRVHMINEDGAIKCLFKKSLSSFRGNVIPINAFCSKRISCNLNNATENNPYSALTVTTSYLDQVGGDQKVAKLVYSVSVQFKNQSFQLQSNENSIQALTIQSFVKDLPEIVHGVINCHLLWNGQGQSGGIHDLTHFMLTNSCSGVVRYGLTDGQTFGIGIMKVVDETSLVLQLVNDQMSSLISALTLDNPQVQALQGSRTKLNTQLKIRSNLASNLDSFRGCFFETSHLPSTRPFDDLLERSKKAAKDNEDELMEMVRKAYLPHKTMGRQTSEESLSSNKSSNQGNNKTSMSRGAELLRLGSRTAELRRGSSEDLRNSSDYSALSRTQSSSTASLSLSSLEPALEEWKHRFQRQLEDLDLNDSEDLLKILTKLQYEILLENGDGNLSLVAFAKTVVGKILTFLRDCQGKNTKSSLEEMMNEYFLVDSHTVGKRKGSKEVRIRDHKLQILFRMEVSWLAPQQDLQKSYLEEILVHLRQISIWDSPNEMISFMQEILAIIYVNDQPEVLHEIYEELNQPLPPNLRAVFSSPSKITSDNILSPTLNPKSNVSSNLSSSSNPASWQQIRGSSQEQATSACHSRKTTCKRPQIHVFNNQQTLQIDLGLKKKAAKKKTPSKKTTRRKTPLKIKTPVKKTPPVKRVRRNLSFDNKEKSKTPKKQMKVFNKTPSKKTPRKGDFSVLVPETPDKGKAQRRKSDGVQIVKESPNVDAIKQGRTPRSLNNLRRKASFYSDCEVSRSIKAAEENREVQELQNFNPRAKVPMKRLFQYTEDNEITIKSPFKVPIFASPSRGERRRRNSSNSSTTAIIGRSLDFQSPCKASGKSPVAAAALPTLPSLDLESPTKSYRESKVKEMGRRSLDFKSPRKSKTESQGSSPTAKKLASVTSPSSSPCSNQARQRKSSSSTSKEIFDVIIADSPLKTLEASQSEFTTPETERRQRTRVARFGIGNYFIFKHQLKADRDSTSLLIGHRPFLFKV